MLIHADVLRLLTRASFSLKCTQFITWIEARSYIKSQALNEHLCRMHKSLPHASNYAKCKIFQTQNKGPEF